MHFTYGKVIEKIMFTFHTTNTVPKQKKECTTNRHFTLSAVIEKIGGVVRRSAHYRKLTAQTRHFT